MTALATGLATPVLGWREQVSFPDIGTPKIKAKIDTGARTSSLHAVDISIDSSRNGPIVRFRVLPRDHDTEPIEAVAPLVEVRSVRSSNGVSEERPVILTSLQIGPTVFETEVTLAKRELMGFEALVGRQALRGRFTVDPDSSFLARSK